MSKLRWRFCQIFGLVKNLSLTSCPLYSNIFVTESESFDWFFTIRNRLERSNVDDFVTPQMNSSPIKIYFLLFFGKTLCGSLTLMYKSEVTLPQKLFQLRFLFPNKSGSISFFEVTLANDKFTDNVQDIFVFFWECP